MPELSFKGKEFLINHHLAVPHRPLVPDAAKSVGEPRLDGNLIIHGDNLHVFVPNLPELRGITPLSQFYSCKMRLFDSL